MTKMRWRAFPHPNADYDYAGAALAQHWPRLHQGDCELYPNQSNLKRLVATHATLKPSMSLDEAATTLQDAWRAYHLGNFGQAVELGLTLGRLGYNVANKAANIYATYLATGKKERLALFQETGRRAEELQHHAPTMTNAWYFHAQALGRYSQEISIASAIAQGLAGKVRNSLERALALEPRHAEAHIALGAYHAAVIDHVGALIGGLTYGASSDAGIKHFETALKLTPHSAIARIEYANGLVQIFGKAKLKEATRLYQEASTCEPADAMERLDGELAKAELRN